MKKNSTEIEIPFGAKDSELYQFTYTIPDGYSAEIKDGKVIVKKKESEDERIRKKMIQWFNEYKEGNSLTICDEEIDSWIAYLERQKELPFVKDVILGYPGLYFYDGERMHFRGNPAMEEKQKEPHFTKRNALFDKCVENCDPEIMKRVSDEVDAMLQKEQKPAEWSEEDKSILNNIVAYKILNIDDLEWLKSLPERFNLQPKQEWNEEDKTCLEYALWCVMKTRHFVAKDACDLDACQCAERWLKSLHPQSHWKPTYKQMAAIEECLQFYTESTDTHQHLKSLLNNLEKL